MLGVFRRGGVKRSWTKEKRRKFYGLREEMDKGGVFLREKRVLGSYVREEKFRKRKNGVREKRVWWGLRMEIDIRCGIEFPFFFFSFFFFPFPPSSPLLDSGKRVITPPPIIIKFQYEIFWGGGGLPRLFSQFLPFFFPAAHIQI